jgi:hypothetical protein
MALPSKTLERLKRSSKAGLGSMFWASPKAPTLSRAKMAPLMKSPPGGGAEVGVDREGEDVAVGDVHGVDQADVSGAGGRAVDEDEVDGDGLAGGVPGRGGERRGAQADTERQQTSIDAGLMAQHHHGSLRVGH